MNSWRVNTVSEISMAYNDLFDVYNTMPEGRLTWQAGFAISLLFKEEEQNEKLEKKNANYCIAKVYTNSYCVRRLENVLFSKNNKCSMAFFID